MQSLFLKANDSGWYPEFLNPVVESVTGKQEQQNILDIGTGPGKLPQLLIEKNPGLQITGIDTSNKMLNEARKRSNHKNIIYKYQEVNSPLEFEDHEFDAVTFCSVLFLLNESSKKILMDEALRVLKPTGEILVLTPTGEKMIISALAEMWKYPFAFSNWTFLIWKIATTYSGIQWQKQKWLEQFAFEKKLKYKSSLVFNNNASLEKITK